MVAVNVFHFFLCGSQPNQSSNLKARGGHSRLLFMLCGLDGLLDAIQISPDRIDSKILTTAADYAIKD